MAAHDASPDAGRAAGGEDEGTSMQGFIRSQMMSILHPVAEHVREVQAQVQQLAKNLNATDGRIDDTKVAIDQNHQDLQALRKGLTDTDTQVEKLHAEQNLTHREKDRLHTDHEVTKSDLAKIANNLRTSNVLLKALQQKSEDLDGDIRALQMGAAKTGRSLLEGAEKTAQVRELAEGLNARHLDLVKDINNVGRSANEAERNTQKLAQRCDKTDAMMQAELSHAKELLDSLEKRLSNSQLEIQRNTDSSKGLDAQVRMIKASLDHDEASSRKVDTLQLVQDRAAATLKDNVEAMGRLEVVVAALQDKSNAHKDDHEKELKDLQEKVTATATKLESSLRDMQRQGDQISKSMLEANKHAKGLDALNGQLELQQLDIKGLQAMHTDTANKVEMHRLAIGKVQADVQQKGSEVESTNRNLSSLKDGLANLDLTISKLGNRYESCNKNIQGMSKGLADVCRHVSQGDHGLLPPKSPRRSQTSGATTKAKHLSEETPGSPLSTRPHTAKSLDNRSDRTAPFPETPRSRLPSLRFAGLQTSNTASTIPATPPPC